MNKRRTVQLTILSVVNRDLKPFRSPKFLAVEVLVDYFVCSISKVLAVEWHTHDKETRTEDGLPLGELDLALVRAVWCADLAQVGDKPVKGAWGACDDKCARAIVERHPNLRVIGKVLVRLRNVRLKVFEE
jgi:hypothetical protein